ncbi:Hypothetical_protein [Hexamita inflata]|uniref:Hypothetical_protein n=1 Tax=Hexamita inflata TaxID=28002 RepID=A0AA86NG08_9EUKA|nr:Hypothetical protein HINF_LOCUS6053 [Hexamita inflata]
MFGIIGSSNGVLKISALSAIYQLFNSTNYNYVGIFGYVQGNYAEFDNINIQISIQQQQISQFVGALIGASYALIQKVDSTIIENTNISSSYCVGLVTSTSSNIDINMLNIVNSTLNSFSDIAGSYTWAVSGGIIGMARRYGYNYNQISIKQCVIYNQSVYSQHLADIALSGGLIGDSFATKILIQQVIINKSLIQALGPVTYIAAASGLISYTFNASIDIQNALVLSNKISVLSSIGQAQTCAGLVGNVLDNGANSSLFLTIIDSKVQSVILLATGSTLFTGVILTSNRVVQLIAQFVSTEGVNTINGVVIANCAYVVSQSQNGCDVI